MLNLFKQQKPLIEFVSIDPAYTYVAKPDNARKFLPDWIKKMKEQTSEGVHPMALERHLDTVRKCVPFLDAMKIGYTIPAPADMYIKVGDYGKSFIKETRSQINLAGKTHELLSTHDERQMGTGPFRGPVLKFINPWKINTRKGYSCLFVSPINSGNKYFECFTGVVDTDNYHNIVNFPFRILNPDNRSEFEFFIKRGEPIIQVIPFKRTEAYGKIQVRGATVQEWIEENKDEDAVAGNFSWYREHTVEKKINLEK
jgi:hypothetical protein